MFCKKLFITLSLFILIVQARAGCVFAVTQTITPATFLSCGTMTINAGVNLVVSGTVSVSGGTTISIYNNGVLTIQGDLSCSGNSGINLSGTGALVVTGNLSVSGNVSLNDGGTIQVNGNATFSGSSSISGTGSLTTDGTTSTSGSATVFGGTGSCTGCTTSSSAPLPIELLEFTAVPGEEKVELKWSTATEANNKFFTIERSKDAVNFEKVVDVTGAGNSTTLKEYFESDYKPYDGLSYYRLKQTDFNGDFKYCKIVSVTTGAKKNVVVFPNPSAKNSDLNLHISGYKSQEVLVVLRDIDGREFYSKVFVAEDNNQFYVFDALKSIPAGTYIIVASSMDKVYHQKLIIK